MKTAQQIKTKVLFTTVARINKHCLKHFGFLPSHIDILQKVAHLSRIDNPLPCNNAQLVKHISDRIVTYCNQIYPEMRKQTIDAMLQQYRK